MFIERISAGLIGSRIDASFYDPIYLEAETAIKEYNHTQLSKVTNFIKKGVFDMPSHLYGDAGVPFLRISDFDGLTVDIDNAIKIPRWKHEEEYKTKLIGGDIVISKVGTTGEIAKVPAGCEVNVSQNLIAVSIDHEKIDGDYLLALLKSEQLNKAIERHVTTIVQGKLTLDIIRELVIPLFVPLAQKYIGDKVRQAEQLRAWAKRCRGKINDYFDGLFTGISLTKPEHHHTRVSLDILVPRLNAEYYSDHYTQVEKGLLDRFGKLTTLGRLAPTVRAKVKPAADCTYKEIGDLDVGKGAFSSGTFYKYGEAPNNAQRIFDEGDVAVSTRRPNRGAVAVIEESSSTTFYSVFLARLKPKNKNFGYWLKEFLRHDAGKLLLLQRCTWTTYPVISEDDIETIPVPEIPNDWDFVARLSRQSVELEAFATNLTTSAKTLVEALIEGQLTEQQLIQAQQALEDGDNSLDQAILSKLSSEGYGIEGATPLFSDIDELYRLLEGAAQAEAEE